MNDDCTENNNEINTAKHLVVITFLFFEIFKNVLRSQGSLLRVILEHTPDH